MKVPEQEQSVGIQGINAPTIQAPSVVAPGAFGAGVADAEQALGNAIQSTGKNFGSYMDMKNRMAQNSAAYDAVSKLKMAHQQAAFDDTPITIKTHTNAAQNGGVATMSTPDEQSFNTTKGWLLRQGYEAQDLVNQVAPQIKAMQEKYGANLSPYARKIYNRLADAQNSTTMGNVIQHQSKELHIGGVQTRQNLLNGLVVNTTLANNAEDLNTNLSHIGQVYDESTNFDPERFPAKDKEKFISSAVNKAATHVLMSTGDLQAAQNLVQEVDSHLNPDDADQIHSKLSSGFQALRTNAEREDRAKRTIDRYDYLQGVIGGKVDWSNLDQVQKAVGGKDPDLAAAIGRVVQNQGEFLSTDINKMADMATIKTMVSLDDPNQVSDFLLKTLNGKNSGNTGIDRLTMLVAAAKQRHDELTQPTKVPQKSWLSKTIEHFMKANPQDAPEMTSQYMLNAAQNPDMSPDKLRAKSIRDVLQKNNPEITGLSTIPNKVSTPGQALKTIYNGPVPIEGNDDGDEPDTTDQ